MFKHAIRWIFKLVSDNIPVLCAGIGTGATMLAIKKAGEQKPKFNAAIEAATKKKGSDLTFKEKTRIRFRVMGKTYITAAIGIGSYLTGIFVTNRKAVVTTALAAAMSNKLEDYKAATEETINQLPKADAAEIKKTIEKKAIEKHNARESKKELKQPKANLKKGEFLYRLACIDKEFWTTENNIDAGINSINESLLSSDEARLSDFLLDVGENEISADLGWRFSDTGLVRKKISYGPAKDGGSATIIKFEPEPYTL